MIDIINTSDALRAEVERLRRERDELRDERDELVQMGALDCREIIKENEKLRSDIARHVEIAAQQAGEIEELRELLTLARGYIYFEYDIYVDGDSAYSGEIALSKRIDAALAAKEG